MDFLVMSHLRWNFVFQRPQQLLTRCAHDNRVFFFEEPIFDAEKPHIESVEVSSRLRVIVPHLPCGTGNQTALAQKRLVDQVLNQYLLKEYVLWYYTPMALEFTRDLSPRSVVYDCMDELSAFRGAPLGLGKAELDLFSRVDLVFTGGQTLYEAKKKQHNEVHYFPSSIDWRFFSSARTCLQEQVDQVHIPHPRLGYCGVIDERIDLSLLAEVADLRPEWQIMMVGPVVKVNESELPRRSNIHYLGAKKYEQLPSYMAGWDVGLLPFALNESTRFISPTKTPEYLAAGLPVVSTPITDVVRPYGKELLVHIADSPQSFVNSVEEALPTRNSIHRREKVDLFLANSSWDLTWSRMQKLINAVHEEPRRINNSLVSGLSKSGNQSERQVA